MNDNYELRITELSGQQELKRARDDAASEANQFINLLISQSSNLESLEQDKQQVLSKHQNKIAFLKAQVQGIVTNIETGIDQLQESAHELKELKEEINTIDDETSKQETVFVEHEKQLQDLSNAFERATIIEELLNTFENVDEAIKSITNYFNQNPQAFSIKLFTTIESLIAFEENLHSKLSEPKLIEFIEEHFKPLHDYNDQLIKNVYSCLTDPFHQTPDTLIRANWIMCAHGEQNTIKEYYLSAMKNEVVAAVEKVNKNNPDEYLKAISGIIDYLPEKLELLMPSLPDENDANNLISTFIDKTIYSMLNEYYETMPRTSLVVDLLRKYMKDIETSLNKLLAMNVGEDFSLLEAELQSSFNQILTNDYQRYLDNIINIDMTSIEKHRDGILYTPGPKDLIDRLLDAYNFIRGSSSANESASLLPDLTNRLADAFYTLANQACQSGDKNYIIASCNNSFDAVKLINEFVKSNTNTIIEELRDQKTVKETASAFTKQLQRPWVEMKNRGLGILSETVISRIISNDDDFRYQFNEKLDSINEILSDMSHQLYQPLYQKFLSIFSRALIPHYIQSYFSKTFEKPKTQEEFANMVTQECNSLAQLFQSLETNLCKPSIDVIEAFRDFMIDSYDNLHVIFHIIAKEYNDFTPGYAMSLVKIRVDWKDNKSESSELWKGFEIMYQNVPQDRGDNFFNLEFESKKNFFEK